MGHALVDRAMNGAIPVADQADAERTGFTGPPTCLIDGRDPFANPSSPTGLACRMYHTADAGGGAR
ncbi:hypothetical protein [Streptomyces sp. NPDC017991]|uniref:hypothetical protein n=1 Tax=Streptomyces sp. NPDC017991 TaxID=3365026 RepID=UPI003788788A